MFILPDTYRATQPDASLIAFGRKCLRDGIVLFIIDDDKKLFYYRGLHEWSSEKGCLTDTCLTAQDQFKKYPDYFRIEY